MTDTGEDQVILVDEQDNEIGLMDKMQAHREGRLHRAISVFIFNNRGELLLQQRAAGKYHSPALWTNTCCTHPLPGETVKHAAIRRLQEEMGLETRLRRAFTFIYKAEFSNGLTEHEYDHVFIGTSDAAPQPDDNEVQAWRYVNIDTLESEMTKDPARFTEWFRICYREYFFELFKGI